MPAGRVDQPSVPIALRALAQATGFLQNSDGSFPWIVVGSYPADFGTTPNSPPFENGWSSTDPFHPVMFKRFLNWVHIKGQFTGGPDNSVVFTLPANYIPAETFAPVAGSFNDGSGVFTLNIQDDGGVKYIQGFAF